MAGSLYASAQQIRDQLQRGFSLFQQRQIGAALQIADTLLQQKQDLGDAHHLRALCLIQLSRSDAAEHAFQQAAQLLPGNAHVHSNFGHFLKAQNRAEEALQCYQRAVQADATMAAAWLNLGLLSLQTGRRQRAVHALSESTRLDPQSAVAWHGLGNALRAQDAFESAEQAYQKALALNPGDAVILINLAICLRLHGRLQDALATVERAANAGFQGPELADIRAGILIDLGHVSEAHQHLRELIQKFPAYPQAYQALAQLLWQHGEQLAPGTEALDVFSRAAEQQADNLGLQLALISFLMDTAQYELALSRLKQLRKRQDMPLLMAMQASAHDRLAQLHDAGSLFRQCYGALASDTGFLNSYTRHLLRANDWQTAAEQAERVTQLDELDQEGWANLGTAWRLLGDEREYWLMDYDKLIVDIAVEPPSGFSHMAGFLAALKPELEALHNAQREPLQQSVKGGSQTHGQLFTGSNPTIEQAKQALVNAVRSHQSNLRADKSHPFLKRNTGDISIRGSWSVRLRSAGRHINHIHSNGWMSSAFYVSLPPAVQHSNADNYAGWISFGEPSAELGLNLPPRRYIQPKEGYLALFPSYMWHGTVPFEDNLPRLTIAFDMLPG